uniref:Uncharacterized protein n=1 Tax=Panagrolaimus superbus TaxID=310955 RepID=A0A914YZA6_9BILA
MTAASVLFVDKTFSIRPADAQKRIDVTENGEEWVPYAMIALTSHHPVQYEAVVNAIKEKGDEFGIKPTFGGFHCDFK